MAEVIDHKTGLSAPKVQEPSKKVEIDEEISKFFPPGHHVTSALAHGASFWTRSARIDVDFADGTSHSYFRKIARDAAGMAMMEAEYEGVADLHKISPDFVPRPVGWGTYKRDENVHFYLAEFVDMIDEHPDMAKFCSALAKLHQDSMNLSNGQFGYRVVTFSGSMHQAVEWTSSWEELWIKAIRGYVAQEHEVHGPSEEMDKLLEVYYEKVCPRLLRPLQTGGRMVKPVLIHGNIWYGNIAINAQTGDPIAFDPAVFWAHNEYELTTMDIPRYRMGRQWMREYHRHFPISAPEEDYDDRMKCYGIHSHICASTLYPQTTRFRDLIIEELQALTDKFPNGYDDYKEASEDFDEELDDEE